MKLSFPLKLDPGQAIGLFELAFDQRASYSYRTRHNPLEAFFVRRSNLKKLMSSEDENLINRFKTFILVDYMQQIQQPIKMF